MPPRVEYKASVEKDLRRLSRQAASRVLSAIEKALTGEERRGEPLSGEFSGLYKLRVGEYRIVYARTDQGYLILRIGHRRDVYRRGRPRED